MTWTGLKNSKHQGKRNKGWRVEGDYTTVTSAEGISKLQIKGSLISYNTLRKNSNHYIMWVMGSKTNTEWFWCGHEPGRKGKPRAMGMHEFTSIDEVHNRGWNNIKPLITRDKHWKLTSKPTLVKN